MAYALPGISEFDRPTPIEDFEDPINNVKDYGELYAQLYPEENFPKAYSPEEIFQVEIDRMTKTEQFRKDEEAHRKYVALRLLRGEDL